jgi:hypothetical protein
MFDETNPYVGRLEEMTLERVTEAIYTFKK